jgi:formate hydrogenlyase subunit 3/multisubunit Na+/H+ antiporter MnhD subunit
MLRLLLDLPGQASQAGWGFVLVLAGSVVSVADGWHAASHPDLDVSVAGLTRRPVGLAATGLGLTLIARATDLPGSASFGLAATLLLMLVSASAGTLAEYAGAAMIQSAATARIARLGGLLRAMPVASIAFAAALLALSALPPAAGFAALWLLFGSLLAAPHSPGLIGQIVMALTAAGLALSAALGTAATIRLIGAVVLSRPRSVRGSAASDVPYALRPILLGLASAGLLLGVLPGPLLRILADPVIRRLAGTGLGGHAGWVTLSTSTTSAGYAPLPLLALVAAITGSVVVLARRHRKEPRITAVWSDGVAPSPSLPFGEPAAQTTGARFLPVLPPLHPRLPLSPIGAAIRLPAVAIGRRIATTSGLGLWLMLLAVGALLLVLALMNPGGAPA